MTQEQLAEAFGRDRAAVNKWEKGATCPDLMLLSPLARLLGVDLNELLCFHADLSEEQLARCLEEVRESFEREGLEAGFALARARMREYPRCAQLAEQLTLFLNAALFWSEADGAARAAYNAELKGWVRAASELRGGRNPRPRRADAGEPAPAGEGIRRGGAPARAHPRTASDGRRPAEGDAAELQGRIGRGGKLAAQSRCARRANCNPTCKSSWRWN